MYKLIIIEEAKAELRKEANHSKSQWGIHHGEKYFAALEEKIRKLRKNPLLYPLRNDILPGIRILNYKGNRIIYTLIKRKKLVAVIAVLSNYQNFDKSELTQRQKKIKNDL